MADGIRAGFEAVREVAFGSILASYSAVGSATAANARIIYLANDTDVDVYVSIDGVDNHLRVKSNSFRLLDLTSNKTPFAPLFLAKNLTFYVKRVSGAPATGTFWIEVTIAEGGR